MVTGHGRATPLLVSGVLGREYEVLCRLREVLPAGVKVTVPESEHATNFPG